VQIAAPKNTHNKNRKRNLDAYATAFHTAKDNPRIKQNRLGEYLDDGPKHKRRRVVEDEDAGEEESVEEDVPQGQRRKTADADEEQDEGSDSEGNEWTMGGLRSDDDDSELDSDEAFGESDEEKFEGYTFRGSKGGKGRSSGDRQRNHDDDIDLDEGDVTDEDGEEEDFGDEGVDLATMLDDEDGDMPGANGSRNRDMDEESDSDQDAEDSASESSFGEDDDDDEQGDEERAARMRDRLDALDGSQRPSASAETPQPAALTVDDLLATLDPASRKQYDAALKTRKKSARPTTLSAPLPKRQQDRLNREVASQKAKEQLDRWRDTVIHNRRAEFLSFPLKHTDDTEPVGKEKFIVDNKPQNELEENIQRIMEESGLSTSNKNEDAEEAAIIKSEELATNNLPVEEVMRRRAELRQARELLFREEIKAKRIAKIKSKSYRRVHRRERERQRRDMVESDNDDDREENDRKRAMARMSTKHRDSKFAKALKQTNRGVWDEGAREAVIEEARRREDLQRRIRGDDVDEGEGSDLPSDGDDEEGFEGFDEKEDDVILKQLGRLKSNGEDDGEVKGLNSLKFMRAADERRRAQNDEDVERIRKELAIADGDEEGSEAESIEDQGLGRAIFGPKGKEAKQQKKTKRPEMEEGEESEADEAVEEEDQAEIITDRKKDEGGRKMTASGPLAKGTRYDRRDPARMPAGQQHEESGWLADPAQKSNTTADETPTLAIASPTNGVNQSPKSKSKARKRTQQSPPPNGTAVNTNGWTVIPHNNDQDDSDPEPTDPIVATQPNGKTSYHNRAFAGDETLKDFTAEKTALIASEDEKEESTHLPGWGSWTGTGLSKSLRRANARQKHNPLFKNKTPGTRPESRKDANLENVIISEKGSRKGKGYLAPILPHGFDTKEQYERSLGMPLGQEWVTKEVFQRGTRPRVVVGKGRVVEALERPLV
jgi:U3 small nucleolar RNA-associated protein 14